MRLINSSSFEFEDFIDPTAVDYAILSHTWADEEVSYQDMISNRSQAEKKLGFTKIREAARLAVEKGFQYVWIDTCCIDKSSSAELSEAINSMFFWYAQSNVCFAHLADLPPGGQQTLEFQQLRDCRWFSRGWTLQELIAPRRLEFYDSEWRFRGTKEQHARKVLKDVTGIEPYALLLGGQPSILAKRSAVEKMIWASQRETTRPEDMAYCLFGLFGVNMPLLYGEGGDKAFIRLQTAILAATNDLSILAWSLPKDMEHKSGFCQILATSPRFF
ncbi:heterokaryon incompatibility protein-domain-containing protein, partial [Podospora australis]